MAYILGSYGDDKLVGTWKSDLIHPGGGDDKVWGLSGDDVITEDTPFWLLKKIGSGGDDLFYGGLGDDKLSGGYGDDTLDGGFGKDTLDGGDGDDKLDGGWGDDKLDGGKGEDKLFGGAGDDKLDGGWGDDKLDGDWGHDHLYGGAGDDKLDGGVGDDKLDGGWGNDKLDGGWGNDTLTGGLGKDVLDGGKGDDIFDFNSTAESNPWTTDVIKDFEGVGGWWWKGGDKIDVSDIDAKEKDWGWGWDWNDAFKWGGTTEMDKGYLWAEDTKGGDTLIKGNTDKDDHAEFQVKVDDGKWVSAHDWTASDFIL